MIDNLLAIGTLLLSGAAFIAYNHKKFYYDKLWPFFMTIAMSLMAWVLSSYYHSIHFEELVNNHSKEEIIKSIDYLKYNASVFVLFGLVIMLSSMLLMFIPSKNSNNNSEN